MTEHFWQQEKERLKGNSEQSNRLLKQTYQDAAELKKPSHPKKLYIECLKNSTYWHHYSSSDSFSIDDMAMLACKNVGCAINYCSLQKQSLESDWAGSSDCMEEINSFNKCMVAERRRYAWMDKSIRPPIYDYVQNRIKEKALEEKYGLLSDTESKRLKDEIRVAHEKEQIEQMP